MPPFRSGRAARSLVTIVVALLAIAALIRLGPGRERLHGGMLEVFSAVQNLPDWGPVLVGAAFIPVCLLFLPGSPVTLFGGFAFGGTFSGLARVTAAVSIGSTLGATLAFLIGRYLARGLIVRHIASRPRFRAIDDAVGRAGFRIVLLVRLSPVFPFNLLNYAFGITGVSLRDYVLASWIGMLPGTILYVYLGSTMRQLAEVFSGSARQSPWQQGLFSLGLLATLVVVIVLSQIARRALRSTIPEEATNLPAERL